MCLQLLSMTIDDLIGEEYTPGAEVVRVGARLKEDVALDVATGKVRCYTCTCTCTFTHTCT